MGDELFGFGFGFVEDGADAVFDGGEEVGGGGAGGFFAVDEGVQDIIGWAARGRGGREWMGVAGFDVCDRICV